MSKIESEQIFTFQIFEICAFSDICTVIEKGLEYHIQYVLYSILQCMYNRYCCYAGREGWKTDTVAMMVVCQRRIENRYCCYNGREGYKTDTVAMMVVWQRRIENRYCCYDGREGQKTDTVAMMVVWQRRIENRYCCYDGCLVEKDRKQILLL